MSTLTVKELAAPTGYDIKLASGETLDLNSQGTVTMPAGSILQVVNTVESTAIATTSTTYSDVGLSLSITPSSTSNKILVMVSIPAGVEPGSTSKGWTGQLLRDSTQIAYEPSVGWTNVSEYAGEHVSWSVLDSPATTSAITYKVQHKSQVSGVQVNSLGNNSTATITAMEVSV